MNTTRRVALARPSALTARPSVRGNKHLHAADPGCAARVSATLADPTLDQARSSIDDPAREALFALAQAARFDGVRRRLFAGVAVNPTEHSAAIHRAPRSPPNAWVRAALPDVVEDTSALLAGACARMRDLVATVHARPKTGDPRRRFTPEVDVGIGGADPGLHTVAESRTIGRSDARLPAEFPSPAARAHDGSTAAPIARFHALHGEA